MSVLCDILAEESGVPRRITPTIFLVALLLFKFTKTEQTKTKNSKLFSGVAHQMGNI